MPLYDHRQKDNILDEVKKTPPGSPECVQSLFEKVAQLRDDEVIAELGDRRAQSPGFRQPLSLSSTHRPRSIRLVSGPPGATAPSPSIAPQASDVLS